MLSKIYCEKFKIGGKDGETRPVIEFHPGLNTVIGDDDRSNSIGKSTFLMVLDFVFGGNDYVKKCIPVQENVKEHTIYFTFKFDGEEYSFGRNTVKFQEVFRCDNEFNCINDVAPLTIDEYTQFLLEHYGLDKTEATWRSLMSKFIRVHGRDTMDASRPLQLSKDSNKESEVKEYMKQFGKYSIVSKYIAQAKTATEEKEAFRKSVNFKHIRMAKNDKEYRENEEQILALKVKEEELADNSSKGLLDLTGMQAQEISELNTQLTSYTRQRARVQTQLNAIRLEMSEGKKSFKRSYSDLERFFPGIEFRDIHEIEKFHQSLSKVLTSEYKESESNLANTYVMLSNQIAEIKQKIAEIKSVPNITQAVLKEYARITTELNNLEAANDNYITLAELKKTAKEYTQARDEMISSQLSEIQDQVNDLMKKIITQLVKVEYIIPSRLKLEKLNDYDFETKGDDGSGTETRGLIAFDLANMKLSNLPFVVHDADLMDPIDKPTLTEIIKAYDSVKDSNKQAFVSFRSFEFYADEVHPILEQSKVIQLQKGGNELFGWAWNKEQDTEKE